MSSAIIFDQSRLKVYDGLLRLCEYAGQSEVWCNTLWGELLTDVQLYDAFVYYLEQKDFIVKAYSFQDKIKVNIYDDFSIDFQELDL